MKKIIFLRHADSKDTEAGEKDIDRILTERGKTDAVKIANKILYREKNVDLIVTSNAVRAVETANLVAEQLKLDSRSIKLRLFGDVEEGDALYTVSQEYVQNVSIYLPSNPEFLKDDVMADATKYLLINALK